MRKYYVSYLWCPDDDGLSLDCAFMMGDPDDMEETIKNWYKELGKKTSTEPEANLTIINWKVV